MGRDTHETDTDRLLAPYKVINQDDLERWEGRIKVMAEVEVEVEQFADV